MSQTPSAPTKLAAGCVVYRHDATGAPLLLLICDQYGRWTLPKGHLEVGESEQASALREVREETGLSGELGALVARIVYTVRSKRGLEQLKQVAFFLLCADSAKAHPQAEEGISAAEWFAPEAALARIGYPQVRDVLARAITMLLWLAPVPPKGVVAITLVMDTPARGLLYTTGITIHRAAEPDRAIQIRARAGANVVHIFIIRRTILLFQVAHVGGLF